MKVVLESILDEIDHAVARAAAARRRIKYIELTPQEFYDFRIEVHERTHGVPPPPADKVGELTWNGVKVIRQEGATATLHAKPCTTY